MNFDVQDMRKPAKNLIWRDYTLFTMDMHNRWAQDLSKTIQAIHSDRLITVGQDEALRSQRPTPFSMSPLLITPRIIRGGRWIILCGTVYLQKQLQSRI